MQVWMLSADRVQLGASSGRKKVTLLPKRSKREMSNSHPKQPLQFWGRKQGSEKRKLDKECTQGLLWVQRLCVLHRGYRGNSPPGSRTAVISEMSELLTTSLKWTLEFCHWVSSLDFCVQVLAPGTSKKAQV